MKLLDLHNFTTHYTELSDKYNSVILFEMR